VGQLDNTYIFLTTDNGMMRGEHRIPEGKIVSYRESIQSRLFAFGPGITPGIDKQIVGNIDLMPTFAEIAGLPVPAWVDGRSLLPRFVPEPASNWRNAFLVQGGPGSEREGGKLDTTGRHFLTLVTMDYDYTKYANSPDREYYDSARDPHQLRNGAGTLTPEFKQAVEQRISELYSCAGVTCREADLAGTPRAPPMAQ
jgi:arylsulfatase A-like enzyme